MSWLLAEKTLTICAPLLHGRRRRFGLRETMAPVGVVDLNSDDNVVADLCYCCSVLLPSIRVVLPYRWHADTGEHSYCRK
ncbi:hypothetical protein ACLOJK_019267 [Asimina triloba]